MRKIVFGILVLLATLATLTGCKKNDWMDWKLQNELYLNAIGDSIGYPLSSPDTILPVHKTSSGLKYCILSDPNPTDARPMTNNTIVCKYKGTLINNAVFDENRVGASMAMSSVIAGFSEGVKKIHNNGSVLLFIPYDLGYKANGAGAEGGYSFIPPYSTLIFEITLCNVY